MINILLKNCIKPQFLYYNDNQFSTLFLLCLILIQQILNTMKLSFIAIIFLLFAKQDSVVDADLGAALAGIALIKDLIILTVNYLQPKGSDGSGHFIQTKFNNGCLDAGFNTEPKVYTVHPYYLCLPNANLKWKFDGPLLKVEAEDDLDRPCLDCSGGSANCDIKVKECTGDLNQRWMVRIHPQQIDNTSHRVYFSIHSQKYASRCLSKLQLSKVDNQLFNFCLILSCFLWISLG